MCHPSSGVVGRTANGGGWRAEVQSAPQFSDAQSEWRTTPLH